MDRYIVEAMILGRWHEPSELDPGDWVNAANAVRDCMGRPRLIIPPTHMTTRLKIPTSNKVPEGVREVTDGARIWWKRQADAREEGGEIYHGVAHVWFTRTKTSHNEVDACCFAAELAFPTALVLAVQDPIRAARLQPHAPLWMLEAHIRAVLRRKLAESAYVSQNRIRTG